MDKTSKMQRSLQFVKSGYLGFYSFNDPMTQLFAQHIGNVQILDNEKDGMVYQVATRKGADHLACCLAYCLIGIDKLTNYRLNVSRGYRMEFVNV